MIYPEQSFNGHSRMILDLFVSPKMFFTSSTDLTVRAWVYEFEESVRIFKGHQHSVGAIKYVEGTCKLGLALVYFLRAESFFLDFLLVHFHRLPSGAPQVTTRQQTNKLNF